MILSEILGKFTKIFLPRKFYQEKSDRAEGPIWFTGTAGRRLELPGGRVRRERAEGPLGVGLVARRRSAAKHAASDLIKILVPRKKEKHYLFRHFETNSW